MNPLRRSLLPALAAAALAVLTPAARAGAPPAAATAAVASAPVGGPDLALADVLALAEQHSLQLKAAALQVPRARVALDRAVAAAAAGGQTLGQALQQRYGVPLPPDEAGALALRRSAELGVEQAALGLAAARQGARLAVTRAYVEWQKAAALAGAQRAAHERARAQADAIRAALDAGTAAPYDGLQAGAQLSAQAAALAAAEAGRELARLALERLVGAPLAAGLRPAADLPEPAAAARLPAAADLVETALARRPEVASARLGAVLREQELAVLARALPAADPALAAARLAVQEAALQVEAARADVRLQVQQALLGAGSAAQRLAALREGEEQARAALRLAELRFAAGTATSLEVLTAQAALSQAEASRIQAAADLAAALAAVRHAAGDL